MMTVHKLSAGLDGGYSYLTRQVASADHRRAGGALADYYAARGNPPGLATPTSLTVGMGKGAEQLGVAGGEAQMRALFGQGLHPDAEAMRAAGAPVRATKLGCSDRGASTVYTRSTGNTPMRKARVRTGRGRTP